MNKGRPTDQASPVASSKIVRAMLQGLLVEALAVAIIGYFFWKGLVTYENGKILPEDTGILYILGPIAGAAAVVSVMIFRAVESSKLPTPPSPPDGSRPTFR